VKKDLISKQIIKTLLKDISKYFLNEDIKTDNIIFLDKELNRVEKREADIVANIDNEYILHLEIQNNNDKNMIYRMLRYYVDIRQISKLPIKQYVLYIGKEKANFQTEIFEEALNFRYNFIDIHTIDCEVLLNQNTPEALVLAILCDFKGKNPKDVVKYIIDSLYKYTKNSSSYKNYIMMLETLSSNRNLKEVVKEIEMLRTTTLQDLPSWEIGLEMGIEKGIEQGIEKGIEKGKLESAIVMIKDFNISPEDVAKKINIPLELLLNKLNEK